jgi:hypothetical protein
MTAGHYETSAPDDGDDTSGDEDEGEPSRTVAELKDELKARDLPTSGSKAELEQRLAEAEAE